MPQGPQVLNPVPVPLHSPPSQFVGTPFTTPTSSTPFEYPFPPSNASNPSASSSAASTKTHTPSNIILSSNPPSLLISPLTLTSPPRSSQSRTAPRPGGRASIAPVPVPIPPSLLEKARKMASMANKGAGVEGGNNVVRKDS